jgi:hypothetical protein
LKKEKGGEKNGVSITSPNPKEQRLGGRALSRFLAQCPEQNPHPVLHTLAFVFSANTERGLRSKGGLPIAPLVFP